MKETTTQSSTHIGKQQIPHYSDPSMHSGQRHQMSALLNLTSHTSLQLKNHDLIVMCQLSIKGSTSLQQDYKSCARSENVKVF